MELLLLLLILWLIAPLVLLPLAIILGVRGGRLNRNRQHLENVLRELYRQGRISDRELGEALRTKGMGIPGAVSAQGAAPPPYPAPPLQAQPAPDQEETPVPGSAAPVEAHAAVDAPLSSSPTDVPASIQVPAPPPLAQLGSAPAEEEGAPVQPETPPVPTVPVQVPSQEAPAPSYRAQPAPSPEDRMEIPAGPPSIPAYPVSSRPSLASPEPRAPVNPANIVLIIGVFFILLAGLIFATTTWAILPNGARTAVILSQSVLFFGVSALAHKRFGLRQTGTAFYALGSLFLPLSVLAVSFFELFPGLSLAGRGVPATGLLAFLLLGGACAVGALLYRFRVFVWSAWGCLTLSVACCSQFLYESYDIMSFWLGVYSLLLLLLWKPLDALYRRNPEGRWTVLLRGVDTFALVNISICAFLSVFTPTWSASGNGALFLFALAFLLGTVYLPKLSVGGAGVFPFALFLIMGILRLGIDEEMILSLLMVGLIPLVVLCLLPPFRGRAKYAPVLCAAFSFVVLFFVAVEYSPDWNAWNLFAFALLTASVLVVSLREPIFRHLLPVFLAVLSFGITDLFVENWRYVEQWTVAPLLLSFLLLRFFRLPGGGRLRSLTGEILLPLCGLYLFLASSRVDHGFIAFTATMSMAAVSAWDRKGFRFVLPYLPLLLILPLYDGWDVPGVKALEGIYALLVIWGVASLFLSKGVYLDKMRLPLRIAVSVVGIALLPWAISYDMGCVSIQLWLFSAYWAVSLFAPGLPGPRKTEGEEAGHPPSPDWALWPAAIGLLLAVYTGASALFPQWHPSWYTLLLPGVLGALLPLAALPAFRERPALGRGHLLLSVGGVQLTALPVAIWALCEHPPLSVYLFLAVLVCGVAFGLLYRWGRSLVGLPQLILLYLLVFRASDHWYTTVDAGRQWPQIAHLVMFCLFAAASRLLYRRFYSGGKGPGQLDGFALVALLAPLGLFGDGAYFAGWILAALGLALLLGRTGSPLADRWLLTGICAFGCCAVWAQGYIPIPSLVRTEWNLLLPAVAMLVMWRWIWPNSRRAVEWLLYGYSIFCILFLSVESLLYAHVEDALILGIGALTLLLLAFRLRRRRWFLLGAVTLICLALYLTRDFWASIAWWMYLLAVGVLLIALGAANERSRQKGGLKSKLSGLWSDWK